MAGSHTREPHHGAALSSVLLLLESKNVNSKTVSRCRQKKILQWESFNLGKEHLPWGEQWEWGQPGRGMKAMSTPRPFKVRVLAHRSGSQAFVPSTFYFHISPNNDQKMEIIDLVKCCLLNCSINSIFSFNCVLLTFAITDSTNSQWNTWRKGCNQNEQAQVFFLLSLYHSTRV